jgi:hypothetical protein
MTLLGLLVPALAAVACGMAASVLHRRMHPRIAAGVLCAVAGTVAFGVLVAIGLVAFGWVGWCQALYDHDQVPLWLGVPALAAIPLVGFSVWRARRRWRGFLAEGAIHTAAIEVVPIDEPVAYAVPGSPGHVVVSSGMLNRLQPDEQQVLLAHEHAHLRHRHHRYLRVVDLAAAAVPVLVPMRAKVRFATERWADEDAVSEVGDRRLVARAISRAAIVQSEHSSERPLELAGLGVLARVDALLSEPPQLRMNPALAVTVAALAATIASSALQLERLVGFAAHICVP